MQEAFSFERNDIVYINVPYYIQQSFVHNHQELTFLYGNDYANKGCLGQVVNFIGEANAISIPTCNKLCPSSNNKYWQDSMYDDVVSKMEEQFMKALATNKPIIPCRKIGEGCSQLCIVAPKIFYYMKKRIDEIKYKHIKWFNI